MSRRNETLPAEATDHLEQSEGSGHGEPAGLLAEFKTPEELLRAAEQVRAAGFRRWDAHTPYPIHGLDRAMGIRDTALGWIVFACGTFGCVLGVWMQWWMNAVDYPLVISGKPLWSLPANIPVVFELTVLFSALGTFFGMLILNGLPRLHHWVFFDEGFKAVTSDGYFLTIESSDPKFDVSECRALLSSADSLRCEVIWEEEAGQNGIS